MRKILLSFLVFILSMSFVGCGDDSKKIVVTPVPTNAFAFIQEVPNQGAMFTPMIGQYVVSGGTTQFQAAALTDAYTGQALAADFGSLYLSSSGDKVAFDLWGGTGDILTDQWDIYVANLDGSVITQVTDDSYEDLYPQLSPDGSKVVYGSIREGASGLTDMAVIRNMANPWIGEQILPMPLGADGVLTPTFSPDGTKIAGEAYGYNEVDGYFDGLVVMDADGSNPQLLTNPYATCNCWDGYPAFTPDGSQIVFTGYTQTDTGDILDLYVINADGSSPATLLTDSVGFNLDPLVVHVPGMADKIIFHSNRDNLNTSSSTGFELYSMNVDGSGLIPLTNNGVFDGLSTAGFVAQGTANAAAARPKNAHGSGAPQHLAHPMHGLQWKR